MPLEERFCRVSVSPPECSKSDICTPQPDSDADETATLCLRNSYVFKRFGLFALWQSACK